jgi:heparin/heparan-sulfate lyase
MNLIWKLIASAGMLPFLIHAADVPSVPNEHPRVYLRASDLDAIRARLNGPLSSTWDRVRGSNDCVSLALRYLIDNDVDAGHSAIDQARSTVSGCSNAREVTNGQHQATIVYDWCYPLLTADDKSFFISQFKRVAGLHAPGYPAASPSQSGSAIVGHDTEGWTLGQVTGGIAIHDEETEMWSAASDNVFNYFFPVRNFFYPAHMHHQGDAYIGERFAPDLYYLWLFHRMGAGKVFVDEAQYVAYQVLYNVRPDLPPIQMRSGDSYDPNGDSPNKRRMLMLAGSFYQDPYLLWFHDNVPYSGPGSFDRAMSAIFRPDIQTRPVSELPTTMFFPDPMGEMVVRTGWDLSGTASPDAVIQMRIGGYFFGNHQHKDFGTFQVYYKGPLAIMTGVYQGDNSDYGSDHWEDYYHDVISKNGLLIYDPSESPSRGVNSGGQRWPNGGQDHPSMLNDLQTKGYRMGQVTAHEFGPSLQTPVYNYIAGDITAAYASQKADKITRSMVTMNTGNATYPAVLTVFDRVESVDPSFQKFWLIHSLQEPEVSGRRIAIVRTGQTFTGNGNYNGKLDVQSLLPENADLTKVGGPGKECWIGFDVNRNYNTGPTQWEGGSEIGAWRVEVTPSDQQTSARFLHVMTVMDNGTDGPSAARIDAGEHVGAQILNQVVLFGKDNDQLVSAQFEIGGSGQQNVLVCDLHPGTWNISRNGTSSGEALATSDGRCIYFQGQPGSYELTLTDASLAGPGRHQPAGSQGVLPDVKLEQEGGNIALVLTGTLKGNVSLSVYDLNGRQLWKRNTPAMPNSPPRILWGGHKPGNGVFVVVLEQNGKVLIRKKVGILK